MRALHLACRENSQHCPQGVGDGAGLGERVVPEQHADAIGIGSAGIAGDGVQLRTGIEMAVKAGFEHRLDSAYAQITKQGGIVHPIEAGAAFAAMDGLPSSGKNEGIALTPVKDLATGLGLPIAAGDEEQLTGRICMGAQGPLVQANEIATEGWPRRRPFAMQIGTQIER